MSKEYLEALDNIKSLLKDDWVVSYWKSYYDTIKQALIQMEKCLGARRNEKALEQMYQLVKYSKAPMKAALWVTNIDGKIEQRVIVEKKDYDIKSKKEQAWDIVKNKDVDIHLLKSCITYYVDSLNAYNSEIKKLHSKYKDYQNKPLSFYLLTQEEFNLLKEMVE